MSLPQADHSSGGDLTKCGVSERDREASINKRFWSCGGSCSMGGRKNFGDDLIKVWYRLSLSAVYFVGIVILNK